MKLTQVSVCVARVQYQGGAFHWLAWFSPTETGMTVGKDCEHPMVELGSSDAGVACAVFVPLRGSYEVFLVLRRAKPAPDLAPEVAVTTDTGLPLGCCAVVDCVAMAHAEVGPIAPTFVVVSEAGATTTFDVTVHRLG